jgi:hypothetical protein
MSCTKHPIRKRLKDCSDCQAELDPVVEKTSRELLAELDAMEKEEAELVIKTPRQKKVKLIVPEKSLSEVDPVIVNDAIKKVAEQETYRLEIENINKFFNEKLKELKDKITSECNITWEHLAIPYGICNLKELEVLEKDGFRLINFYKADVAKVSGFKEDVAVFERVVRANHKKSISEWKEKYEGKK